MWQLGETDDCILIVNRNKGNCIVSNSAKDRVYSLAQVCALPSAFLGMWPKPCELHTLCLRTTLYVSQMINRLCKPWMPAWMTLFTCSPYKRVLPLKMRPQRSRLSLPPQYVESLDLITTVGAKSCYCNASKLGGDTGRFGYLIIS